MTVKKTKRPKPRKRRDAGARFLDEVGRYLRSIGWRPLVAGPIGISPGARKYQYQLVVAVTGAPPK